MTSAQRQARYRTARRDPDGPMERPVNMVLTEQAIAALARIAAHTGPPAGPWCKT
ncbi:MAG: hypothetical protein H6524_02435 [Actinobacteria bacterium]|nr:hypothetical protein [Actinomycetota bacterium]